MNGLLAGESRELMDIPKTSQEGSSDHGVDLENKRHVLGAISRAISYFLSESENEPNQLSKGPEYHAVSSGGVKLQINSILYNLDKERSRYLLIVRNSSGEIVGYRTMAMIKGGEEVLATGYVNTLVRGKGISTVIDSANLDLLKRFSENTGKPVRFIINDSNRTTGDETGSDSADETLERKRWKSVYGLNGAMQANSEGEIVIPLRDHAKGLEKDPIENINKIV